ncbi:hypothetical protein RFI_00370 [Reticulomyxa filosa]|uniref:Uncharacterized protein n=1 Tax=Reticulomyxa filosa TaxID=46433 RepID=X6PG74_RETFI|nr:hypothetical protein RFI_00370 [Reticulomyxa filosa]|eukprot:ETO36692.1 hypothetical protein RFI_00370 [Reticulomyxa filosa]
MAILNTTDDISSALEAINKVSYSSVQEKIENQRDETEDFDNVAFGQFGVYGQHRTDTFTQSYFRSRCFFTQNKLKVGFKRIRTTVGKGNFFKVKCFIFFQKRINVHRQRQHKMTKKLQSKSDAKTFTYDKPTFSWEQALKSSQEERQRSKNAKSTHFRAGFLQISNTLQQDTQNSALNQGQQLKNSEEMNQDRLFPTVTNNASICTLQKNLAKKPLLNENETNANNNTKKTDAVPFALNFENNENSGYNPFANNSNAVLWKRA